MIEVIGWIITAIFMAFIALAGLAGWIIGLLVSLAVPLVAGLLILWGLSKFR